MHDEKPEHGNLLEVAPAKAATEEKPSSNYTTRELYRFIRYFSEKIRPTSTGDTAGVIRNIQRLIDKGLGVDQFAIALENYANDEWLKAQDVRYRKTMRQFFTFEIIKEWQTPRPQVQTKLPRPQITFTTDVKPEPAQPKLAEELDDLLLTT